jgi:hypothetical protein
MCNTDYLDNQVYHDGKKRWHVSRLVKLSENLKVMRIPLSHMSIYGCYPKPDTTMGFVEAVQQVLDADLKYPIILDDEGWIMDGRHRLLKALLTKEKYILAVRFEETPKPCYTVEE